MMKSYTLSYFLDAYLNELSVKKWVDSLKSSKGGNKFHDSNETLFAPSETSVKEILDFSKAYEVLDSRITKSIELIKN